MRPKISKFDLLADSIRERKNKQSSMTGEICRRIRYLKIEAGCDKIPADLYKLARHLNVHHIQEVPLAMNGRLLKDNNVMTLEVNDVLSPMEKRHTIAHELSHIIIEGKLLSIIPNRVNREKHSHKLQYQNIETLCDKAASEILLPFLWLRSRIKYSKPSLDLLQTIASESETSLDYVVVRVSSERLWKCRFLYWHMDMEKDKIYVSTSYPSSNIEHSIYIDSSNLQSSLIVTSLLEQKYKSGKETLVIEGAKYNYNIECLPLDKTNVISMLIYPS